jgi:hypothetical protein
MNLFKPPLYQRSGSESVDLVVAPWLQGEEKKAKFKNRSLFQLAIKERPAFKSGRFLLKLSPSFHRVRD